MVQGRVPEDLAVGQAHRRHAAVLQGEVGGVGVGGAAEQHALDGRGLEVGRGDHGQLAVEVDPPQQPAARVGVQRQDVAGLGGDDQGALATIQCTEDWRAGDVPVGTLALWAVVGDPLAPAADQRGVALVHLVAPQHLAGGHADGHHRVAGGGGREGRGVAGAEVDNAALRIDGRGVPDG